MAKTKQPKKGAVISGGGAFGAFGAGTLARINEDYKVVAGISTGALMGILVALQEWEILRDAYTSVTNKDIFDRKWYRPHPFKKDGSLNIFALLYSLLLGKKTLATSKKMRKLIDQFITEEQFKRICESDKEFIVGCQNIRQRPSLVHYFSTNDISNMEDFKDWMWFSANAPFATSLVSKKFSQPDNPNIEHVGQWTDGGLTELMPLQPLYDKGCTEIDVIIHRHKKDENIDYNYKEIKNLPTNALLSFEAMRYDIEMEKLPKTIEYFQNRGVKVRVFWLPRKLAANSLVFDKKQMLDWYTEGYDTAFDENRVDIYEPFS
jgi:predicted acylesterase/phospholipase RssA